MAGKTESISMRVTAEEKEIIEKRAKEKGYKSTAAYILSSAENHVTVNIDTTHLRDLAIYTKEVADEIDSITEIVKERGYTTSEDLLNIENRLKSINDNIKQQNLKFKSPKITIFEK